jgi:GWxTD domain-containing protein
VQTPVAASAICGGSAPYAKWLNEDVSYIITPAEREHFVRLGSSPECATFIEDFWAKRGSGVKEEHYRRIMWVNRRYQGDPPGWTTDRGRIYIVYGPPAEIEAHPSGSRIQRPLEQGGGITSTHPFELWLYRHVPGIGDDIRFEFVDNKMDGSYPLVAVRDRINTAILQRPPGHTGAGPMQAIFVNPRVFIDGADRGSAGVTSVSGSLLFAAHRAVGGFELAFEANALPGSAAIGVVKGNRLEAHAGGHTLGIETSVPIFAGQTVTVYGRFDPNYSAREVVEFGVGVLRRPELGVPLNLPR